MASWVAVKVRIDCPECGSPVQVDGPYKQALCSACGAEVSMANAWKWIVDRAREEGAGGRHFRLSTLMQAGRGGLGTIYVGLNKDHPPLCSSCDEVLGEVETEVPDGTDGTFHCPACGASLPTWPAPGYLAQAKVAQVFLAPPEDSQSTAEPAAASLKPILFECPNCGAKLTITGDSRRVSTCEYCDADMFLPAALWNQLHPVRRRRAFWLRCK